MSRSPSRRCALALSFLVALAAAPADDAGWTPLVTGQKSDFATFRGKTDGWQCASSVSLDPKNPRRLAISDGAGLLVNGPRGRAADLITKDEFADVEVHAEFLIPKGSNSGVKLMGLYEIQIFDSQMAKELKGSDCGGIYPRAEHKPVYHHLDKGFPPLVNACRPAGEWQTLDLTFTAARFSPDGKKTANATFVKVLLNGQLVQDHRDVGTPTGANHVKKEPPRGPILLQGDHGPVAFRNVRVRPLGSK